MARCALALVAATALVGCGSDDSGSSDVKSSGGTDLTVEARDFEFAPAVLTLKAGESVHLSVRNAGSTEHNFSLDEADVDADIEEGEDEDVTFTAPNESGDYTFYCEYHRDQGMKGTIHVTGAAAGGTDDTTATTRGSRY